MSDPPEGQPDGRRTKVAILGGGCGGLAAAWQLTATPALRERFEVDVYEAHWQLGGKGASSRAVTAGSGGPRGERIHEHGLHIWFGFYEHAFRMLRGAYEEAGLASGEDWWKLPFLKCDGVSLYEQHEAGGWHRLPVHLPRRGGADRGPPTAPQRLALGRAMARTIRLLATGVRAELGRASARRGEAPERADSADGAVGAAATLDLIATEIDSLESPLLLGASDGSFRTRGLGALTRGRAHVPPSRLTSVLDPLLDQLNAHLGELRIQLQTGPSADRLRLWRGVVELAAASIHGIVHDDVLRRGLAALDEEDFRAWLNRHGASEQTLAGSPVLRGLYDLTFAYRAGDKTRPSLAAGKALQSLLMMINYEGSFMWRMRAGMGEVVFAPLYLALRDRGVNFHFLSEVTRLRLKAGRPVVDAVELMRRATVAAGPDAYEPLRLSGEWWCWPDTPDHVQLTDSEPRPDTLRRGEDFDHVVLAIPVGALPPICEELIDADARFKLMVERVQTVCTRGLQLWLTKPIDELRRGGAGAGLDPPATAYAEPFDTYCDMTHLLDTEAYSGDQGPRGLAYFCAVLPDSDDEALAQDAVRQGAIHYLEREVGTLWPAAIKDGAFDWEVLFDPDGRSGSERLDAQYWRANVSASDRYVTTFAGSVDARLHPDQSGFENVVLAGDWTHNDIDGGCVEAAVISGERAGQVLIDREGRQAPAPRPTPYVEYGAFATAPGPLRCDRARLYCFLVRTDRARVQRLCDRVLKEPTGGARRYVVPRLAPVILTFGTIAGLRSLHPAYADRGSAFEPEAAIWVPTIAQRYEAGRYVDEHLAIFMPYLWVDDPIAFASGREVYGFAKTQGWMRRLDDPRANAGASPPDPPETLVLDVHGARDYGPESELGRRRLLTVRRRPARRSGSATDDPISVAEGSELSSLVAHLLAELEPSSEAWPPPTARRSRGPVRGASRILSARGATLADLLSRQVVHQVFLKQVRHAEDGDLAVLQQVVEARSSVLANSLRWRRLRSSYELSIESLATHPLDEELGLTDEQTVRLAFAAEFGFRMDPGLVRWPES